MGKIKREKLLMKVGWKLPWQYCHNQRKRTCKPDEEERSYLEHHAHSIKKIRKYNICFIHLELASTECGRHFFRCDVYHASHHRTREDSNIQQRLLKWYLQGAKTFLPPTSFHHTHTHVSRNELRYILSTRVTWKVVPSSSVYASQGDLAR